MSARRNRVAHARIEQQSHLGRCAVADSPATSPEMLSLLGLDSFISVRWLVARNNSTPPATLALLAADPSLKVRLAVASNRHTPSEILGTLADDKPIIQAAVADNPNTPPDALMRLAQPQTPFQARVAVAKNPNAPTVALNALLDIVDMTADSLVNHANARREVWEALIRTNNHWVHERLVWLPYLPADLLYETTIAGPSKDIRLLATNRLLGRPDIPDHMKAAVAIAAD